MIAVDSNVLIDVVEADEQRARDALAALDAQSRIAPLVVAPLVYAELCAHPGWTGDEVDRFLRNLGVSVDWPMSARTWRDAGHAYGMHATKRRRSGAERPRRIVADFIIGAHAASLQGLLTRDPAFFEAAFPGLAVLSPEHAA